MGAEDWHDPHGIIPEAFKNTYPNADSVRAALRHAERLPSSTPAGERPTCPECDSVTISPVGTGQGRTSRWDWKCGKCKNRFNEPDKPDMYRYNDTEHLRFQFQDDESLLDPKWRAELDRPFDYPDELAEADKRGESPVFATLDEETRTALAILLYRPWTDAGPAYREMAPLFPHSHYWIGRRVRAWKDGEHRELVPDPTAADVEPITVDESSDATAVATDGGRVRRWDAYGGD
jgi:ribosomal protein L37AE/L43A